MGECSVVLGVIVWGAWLLEGFLDSGCDIVGWGRGIFIGLGWGIVERGWGIVKWGWEIVGWGVGIVEWVWGTLGWGLGIVW